MNNFFSASQVADFVYCQRSFFLKIKLGIGNLESEQIRGGLAYHKHHSWQVLLYSLIKKATILLLIIFIILSILLFFKTKI